MMLSSASICLAPIKLERSYGECGERQKKGDINMSRSGYETMSFIHRTKGPVSNWKGPRKGWKFIYIYIYLCMYIYTYVYVYVLYVYVYMYMYM